MKAAIMRTTAARWGAVRAARAVPWVAIALLLWARHPSRHTSVDRLTREAAEASGPDLDVVLDQYWSALSLAALDVLRQSGDLRDAVARLARLPTPTKHVAGYRRPQKLKITVVADGDPRGLLLIASAERNRNLGGYVAAFESNDEDSWQLRGEVRVEASYEIERVWRSADGNRLIVAQTRGGTQSYLLKVTTLDLAMTWSSTNTLVFVNGWPSSTQERGVVFEHSLSFLPWDERWAAHNGTVADPFVFSEYADPWSTATSPTLYSLVPIDHPRQVYPPLR